MSKIDIFIVLVLALGGFLGYRKGFLMELFFFAGLILGVFVGFRLMGAGVTYLQKHFNADTKVLPYISFALIFILVVVGVIVLGKSVKSSVDNTFLGRMDEIAGAFLGVFKYAFCLSVVFWLAASLHYRLPNDWTKNAWLFPPVAAFAPKMAVFFGRFVPFFNEIFKRF